MPFCKIGIAEENNFITDIFFVDEQRPISQDALITPVIKKAADQLYEYFAGKRRNFDLPLFCHGSKFQLQVWQALETIPYGETRSYKEIAQLINNPRACRAVGKPIIATP